MKKIGFLTLLILVTVLFTLAFTAAAAGPKISATPALAAAAPAVASSDAGAPASSPHRRRARSDADREASSRSGGPIIFTAIAPRRSSTWIWRSTKLKSACRSHSPEAHEKLERQRPGDAAFFLG